MDNNEKTTQDFTNKTTHLNDGLKKMTEGLLSFMDVAQGMIKDAKENPNLTPSQKKQIEDVLKEKDYNENIIKINEQLERLKNIGK